MNEPAAPRRPRRSAPAEDHLYRDPRSGLWYWRMVDPRTGKRRTRPTHQKRRDLARREGARLEDELRAELAGIKTFDAWRAELRPLLDLWLAALEVSDAVRAQKSMETARALDTLGLRVAADLTHVGELDARLRALGKREDLSASSMRRQYQDQLKQFARWLAANGRHLPSNPLLAWEPLRLPHAPKRRRCVLPEEMARALAALDVLDRWNRRAARQRPFFVALLVAAPRVTALATRDVRHLDAAGSRIDFGAGSGKKRMGAGALDPRTLAELEEHARGRAADAALFPSADGARWSKERALDAWREAFTLGVVAELWPRDLEPDQELAVLAAKALVYGRPRVSRGGRPPADLERRAAAALARAELEARVVALADLLRDDVAERLEGVDQHGFRTTHQTWALALGVPPAIVDRQLGHAGQAADRALASVKAVLVGSRTGARHYLDLDSSLVDPVRSAVAVRDRLELAEAALRADMPAVLRPGASRIAATP